jgi:hypothetical protein
MFGGHYFGRHFWGRRFFGSGGEPVPLTFPTAPGQIITTDETDNSFAVDLQSAAFSVDALSSVIVAEALSAQITGG